LAFYTYEVESESELTTSDAVDPVKSLHTRKLVVGAFGALVFLISLLLGLLILLRPPDSGTSPAEEDLAPTGSQSTSHDQLRRILLKMGAALILAFLAQQFFEKADPAPGTGMPSSTEWLIASAILYVAAMVLFALAAPGWQPSRSVSPQPDQPDPPRPAEDFAPDARIMRPDAPAHPIPQPASTSRQFTSIGVRRQVIWFILAIVPYALALILFHFNGENPFVRWLWLAGILIFLGGQILRPAWH